MTTDITTPWMELYSGTKFSLDQFALEDIKIEDIAHSLSMQCRYGGHCKRFYSVAEHSCLVSDWVWRRTGDRRHALAALMHDASEAYLADIPRPTKLYLPEYKRLESRVEAAIYSKFGLMYPLSDLIKEADSRIIHDERAALFEWSGNAWTFPPGCEEPLHVRIECLIPETAERCFLERWYDMNGDTK